MFKQIVFTAVAVMMVSQAHAVGAAREGKESGKSSEQVLREEALRAKENGSRSAQDLKMAGASKALDKYIGDSMSASEKQSILQLASQDKEVARALVELVKSKKADQKNSTDNNKLINDAQINALHSLAKIPDLAKRVSESTETSDKLTATERTVFNLVVRVASKARGDWAKDDKAVAAEAITIFGEEAKSKSLDEALKSMTKKMAEHPDQKLRATINEDAIKKFCS